MQTISNPKETHRGVVVETDKKLDPPIANINPLKDDDLTKLLAYQTVNNAGVTTAVATGVSTASALAGKPEIGALVSLAVQYGTIGFNAVANLTKKSPEHWNEYYREKYEALESDFNKGLAEAQTVGLTVRADKDLEGEGFKGGAGEMIGTIVRDMTVATLMPSAIAKTQTGKELLKQSYFALSMAVNGGFEEYNKEVAQTGDSERAIKSAIATATAMGLSGEVFMALLPPVVSKVGGNLFNFTLPSMFKQGAEFAGWNMSETATKNWILKKEGLDDKVEDLTQGGVLTSFMIGAILDGTLRGSSKVVGSLFKKVDEAVMKRQVRKETASELEKKISGYSEEIMNNEADNQEIVSEILKYQVSFETGEISKIVEGIKRDMEKTGKPVDEVLSGTLKQYPEEYINKDNLERIIKSLQELNLWK